MDASFWHQKWVKNDIGFHQSQVNPFLLKHFQALSPAPCRVFVPLCGKSLDIAWLLAQGCDVTGVELSAVAIESLFETLNLAPDIRVENGLTCYRARNIQIFVGDFFRLAPEQLGAVDAVYDRAALVALPSGTRKDYAAHLLRVTRAATQLLVAYEYDQSLIDGPPFSVNEQEIRQLYGSTHTLRELERQHVEGGMKGKVPSIEVCWSLSPTQ